MSVRMVNVWGSRPDDEDLTARHHPTVLRGRGTTWATCSCGWISRIRRTAVDASYEWAEHMAEVNE